MPGLDLNLDYVTCVLVFIRISAFLVILPFFSMTNFPPTMRIALGAFSAILITPLVPPAPVNHLGLFGLVGMMAQEVAVGLLLGFVSRMVFYAVDLAGNVASAEMGLSLATMMNPMSGQTLQAPGTILFFLAAVVMFTLDLHHWVLIGFERTYSVLPIGGAHLSATLFEAIVKHTGRIFMVAMQILAPLIAVSFVVTLVFSVLSRAVPSMNVFSESFAFRVVGGLIVFGFTLNLTAQHVLNYLNRLPDDLLRVAQMLAGG